MVYKGKVIFRTKDHDELRNALIKKVKEIKNG